MKFQSTWVLCLGLASCGVGLHLNGTTSPLSSHAPAQLVASNLPQTGTAGLSLPPIVYTVMDSGANPVSSWSQSMTVNAYNTADCSGSITVSVSGGSAQAPASGVATFANLQDSRGEVIYLQASSGPFTSSCSPAIAVTAIGALAAVYPNHGANWNDYVKNGNGGSTVFNQPDQACTGSETGNYYTTCIHGGEKKWVAVPGYSSCIGLTAKDTLGAFNWTCDGSSGTATFYTLGLTADMGLAQLINSTGTAFLPNAVGVFLNAGATPILVTPATVWWSNAVTPAPNSASAAQQLGAAGTIYTLTAALATSQGYNISADRVGLVSLPGVTVSAPPGVPTYCTSGGGFQLGGGSTAYLCSDSAQYAWVEINLDIGGHNGAAIFGTAMVHWRIHDSKFINGGGGEGFELVDSSQFLIDSVSLGNFITASSDGIDLDSSNYFIISRVKLSENSFGIDAVDSSHNVFSQVVGANQGGDMIYIETSSAAVSHNIIVQSVAMNTAGGNGFHFDGTVHANSSNTVLGVSSTQSYYSGLNVSQADHSTFSNLLLTAGGSAGLLDADGSSNTYIDVLAANGFNFDITLTSAVGESFAGSLMFGNSFGSCNVTGGSGNQLVNSTCFYGPGTSTAPTATTADLTSSFAKGIVTTNDSANATPQASGTALFANVIDWVDFSSLFRGWGPSGTGTDLDTSRNARCQSGTCQIYDSRLAAGSPYVDFYGAYPTSAGQPCPASVNASIAANVITDANGAYLKNAFEWIAAGTGNGDGLCNSGEFCIYAGNIGGYQGEALPGVPLQGCVFQGGTITGVTMLGYPVRGI